MDSLCTFASTWAPLCGIRGAPGRHKPSLRRRREVSDTVGNFGLGVIWIHFVQCHGDGHGPRMATWGCGMGPDWPLWDGNVPRMPTWGWGMSPFWPRQENSSFFATTLGWKGAQNANMGMGNGPGIATLGWKWPQNADTGMGNGIVDTT